MHDGNRRGEKSEEKIIRNDCKVSNDLKMGKVSINLIQSCRERERNDLKMNPFVRKVMSSVE